MTKTNRTGSTEAAPRNAPNPWPTPPSMTRAHFEYLARILNELVRENVLYLHQVDNLAEFIGGHLADTNARFDGDKFIAAATR